VVEESEERTSHQALFPAVFPLIEMEVVGEESDAPLAEEVDRVLAEVAEIDHRILQNQASIDDLKEETRTMLTALRESAG